MEAIEIKNLTKVFYTDFLRKPILAVDNLTFSVKEGEVFGFLGPNGAGKTTTIKILVGLIRPTEGEARIFGTDVADISSHEFIGYLPEMPNFYDYLTGNELMKYFARLFNIKEPERTKRIEELLKLVGLWEVKSNPVRSYSKGMLQRLGIAQALINDPKLLILDEPMSGLDPIGRKEVRDLILGLKSRGKTVFFSTHIIPDVELICDRIAILNKGRLLSIGKLDELSTLKEDLYEVVIFGLNSDYINKISELAKEIIKKDDLVIIRGEKREVDEVIDFALNKGGRIKSLIPIRRSLEELFIAELQNKNKGVEK